MIIYYFWSISDAHVRSYECYFSVHFLAQRLKKKKKNERKKISEEERLREEEEKEDERNSRKNEEAEREA